MEKIICPACKAQNEEDAVYCDQCSQHLTPPDAGDEEGSCPACGGVVESQGGGKGVCAGCGLELVETPDEEAPAPAPRDETVARLTAAILQKTRAGMPVEQAVADGCREILGAPAPGAAPKPVEKNLPCPLCGADNAGDASQCGACGLWFARLRAPQTCPRCERGVAGDGKCECGAILTLPALLDYIEPSVRWVCARCKAPYAVAQPKCPDCGGGLLSAERIKAFAAGR